MAARQEEFTKDSKTAFGAITEGKEVAEAFKDQIAGKNILITGITTKGLGAELAKTMVPYNPALIILASHDPNEVANLIGELRPLQTDESATALAPLLVDLSSFASVRKAAQDVIVYLSQSRSGAKLDILVNNASPEGLRSYTRRADGYETIMGIAHLGHFLLSGLLRSSLAPRARIVNLTSLQHRNAEVTLSDLWFRPGEAHDRDVAYARAMAATIFFTKGLARRGFVSFAVQTGPGRASDQSGKPRAEADVLAERFGLGWKTFQQAVATYVVAAFQPGLDETDNGAFLSDCQVEKSAAFAESESTVENLWKFSEELVGQRFGSS
ncbi:hypothetical protein QBC33DRAFT_548659 [Phialemonium atrogriseum]|uniref:Uncharacterized protein n=1 Tax=Phialemonium atrogriseum TaxID=1093897 RepID=A0AAJ0FE13_9PEZI|nr:uncharacterized protein QBC33DRAFT_548659 [Phialemonium atrogriseum]KAK1763812.1 hypothetical protein QBC33DRAFT_548659 [Phialemonium atrogriseum]